MVGAPDEPKFTDTAEREIRARIGGLFDAAPPTPQRLETPDTKTKRPRRGFRRLLRSFVIAFAVVYVVCWGLAVSGVVWLTNKTWRPSTPTNTMDRIASSAPSLAYRLPVDPTITPDRAGVAFARLTSEPTARPGDFKYRDVGARPAVPWRVIPLPVGLFKGNGYVGAGLPPADGVFPAIKNGLSSTQRDVLRLVGTAPVWREFDLLARAGAADILGGRLVLPFADSARWYELPSAGLREIRDLSVASVSRSAWHLASGRPDSAETALRGVISVGALLVENSPFVVEQVVGTRAISTGRDALIEFYALRGDSRGAALKAATEATARNSYRHPVAYARDGSADDARSYIRSFIESRDVARGIRFDMLHQLPLASCKSFREVAFGAKDVAPAAVALLKRDVARFASDSAVLDLPRRSLNDPIPEDFLRDAPRGAASILFVSRMLFNPRIANCVILR